MNNYINNFIYYIARFFYFIANYLFWLLIISCFPFILFMIFINCLLSGERPFGKNFQNELVILKPLPLVVLSILCLVMYSRLFGWIDMHWSVFLTLALLGFGLVNLSQVNLKLWELKIRWTRVGNNSLPEVDKVLLSSKKSEREQRKKEYLGNFYIFTIWFVIFALMFYFFENYKILKL